MRPCFNARRLLIPQSRCRQSFSTSPNRCAGPAPDQSRKNEELLDFLSKSKQDLENPATSHIELPQSPLTDPKLVAARLRHREAKPREDPAKHSEFQTRLRKNPYGMPHLDVCKGCHSTDQPIIQPTPSQHLSASAGLPMPAYPPTSSSASAWRHIPRRGRNGNFLA